MSETYKQEIKLGQTTVYLTKIEIYDYECADTYLLITNNSGFIDFVKENILDVWSDMATDLNIIRGKDEQRMHGIKVDTDKNELVFDKYSSQSYLIISLLLDVLHRLAELYCEQYDKNDVYWKLIYVYDMPGIVYLNDLDLARIYTSEPKQSMMFGDDEESDDTYVLYQKIQEQLKQKGIKIIDKSELWF